MTKIGTQVIISSAHFVQTTKGQCSRLHGHNWKVEVEIDGQVNANGMVVDFNKIKDIINFCDHKVLIPAESKIVVLKEGKKNTEITIKEFFDVTDPSIKISKEEMKNPKIIKFYSLPNDEIILLPLTEVTAENLALMFACWIFDEVRASTKIKVWESEKSWAYAERNQEG